MPEASANTPSEQTFSSYTKAQGANYARNRPGYDPNLYKTVLEHHGSTGGQFDTLIDVGCGPGVTAGALAPHFAHVLGLDQSEGMINTARSRGGVSASSEPIRFDISSAEDLGRLLSPPVEESSVDLITASAAAHWFDMARFYPQAVRALKPGGTVAFWVRNDMRIHPSTPNAAAIQAVCDELEERHLKPFFEPGNILAREAYVNLPLPWTIASPVEAFDKESFVRREFDKCNDTELALGSKLTVNMDKAEAILGTSSPVQRWRDANPDAAGTERDIIRIMRREIERLQQEVGVKKGEESLTMTRNGVLLMIKKRHDL